MSQEFKHYPVEQQAMIDWLSTRSPDVWHLVAEILNFDFALDVFEWILTQPECDLATAAVFFWRCNPTETIFIDPNYQDDQEFLMLKRLVERVKAGFYSRSEILFHGDSNIGQEADESIIQELRDIARDTPEEQLAWTLPEALVPPFGKRPPDVPEDETFDGSEELRKLQAGLGFGRGNWLEPEHLDSRSPRSIGRNSKLRNNVWLRRGLAMLFGIGYIAIPVAILLWKTIPLGFAWYAAALSIARAKRFYSFLYRYSSQVRSA